MKYLIRNNNKGEIISNFEGKSLSDTLKKDYRYIYESMKANNYDIHFDAYSLFFELVYESKVVGFVTYFVPQASSMSLTDTFVLPDFESQNLLFENFVMLTASGTNISILNPSRDIVEFLVKNNFATKLTDSIVTSAISFDMLNEDIVGNFNLNDVTPSTNIYDLNLCSPIFLYDITTPGVCEIFYLKALDCDDKKYYCRKFRNSINIDEYFHNIKMTFLENSDEFNQTLIDLKESLPDPYMTYNEIIGDGDDLSDYFEGMIAEGMVDRKTAVKIRNQLKKEYENEEVTDKGLTLRVSFLIAEHEHEVNISSFDEINMQFDFFCPYCHSQVSPSSPYCQTCGYSTSKKGLLSIHDIKKL